MILSLNKKTFPIVYQIQPYFKAILIVKNEYLK